MSPPFVIKSKKEKIAKTVLSKGEKVAAILEGLKK
jgi:hypothetical protein